MPGAKLPPPEAPAEPAVDPEALIEIRLLTIRYGEKPGADGQQRTREQALSRARNLASLAREGTDLGQLVRQYGDPVLATGASPRKIRRDDAGLPSAVRDAAFELNVGDFSAPVDAEGAFWVVERREDPPIGPTTVAARHILIGHTESERSLPGVTRSKAEAKALATRIASEAQKGARWEDLAAQYTDEPGSKETGGDLGRFGRGAMVPSFEAVAFRLKVDEISDVVETPFGFHVIQRTK